MVFLLPIAVWGEDVVQNDIQLKVTLYNTKASVTAYEPILIKTMLSNTSAREIRFSPSINPILIEIQDVNHNIVAKPMPSLPGRDNISALWLIAPGKSRDITWIVSSLYTFEKPGLYTINAYVRFAGEPIGRIAESSVAITIAAFDATKLENRCEEIFKPIRVHEDVGKFSIGTRAKALYSIHNDIVLPYLDWIAREWADRYACLAIRRIGTKRAIDLIDILAARKDKVGLAARQSLNLSISPMWFVIGD
jgi:hypothetical protein